MCSKYLVGATVDVAWRQAQLFQRRISAVCLSPWLLGVWMVQDLQRGVLGGYITLVYLRVETLIQLCVSCFD
jgi:hypothetical protein